MPSMMATGSTLLKCEAVAQDAKPRRQILSPTGNLRDRLRNHILHRQRSALRSVAQLYALLKAADVQLR
jgi:hypothetical protein